MSGKIKSFDEIVGHRNLIKYLNKCLEKDNIPDVAIFHGNPGLGKSSIAKVFAVELVTKYENPELKHEYIKYVIENNESTDSIKIFNMSEIREKEEEIQKVKAEMNIAFSRTQKKVLLLDEAHNMSRKAQDSILPELEHLQEGIYVFICTTEINSLRPALVSRSKATFKLNDLSEVEARKLCRQIIADHKLSFNLNTEMVVALICDWAQNQPRKIRNLLDNFEENTIVASDELEVFISRTASSALVELVKYLYGSLTLGISYLDSMRIDESFVTMLIEMTKAALGTETNSLEKKDVVYIRSFLVDKDVNHLIRFTAEVAGLQDLQKRRIISAFMKSHVSYQYALRPANIADSRSEDLRVLCENAEDVSIAAGRQEGVQPVTGLEEFFESLDIV